MKFLVFIAIVVSLWYGMRWVQQAGAARLREREAARERAETSKRTSRRATDLMACPTCGSYVPSEFPSSCGRRECPFPGIG